MVTKFDQDVRLSEDRTESARVTFGRIVYLICFIQLFMRLQSSLVFGPAIYIVS
jgi:hypothetical protein